VRPPSIPDLNRRSGRIPALPCPPIKLFHCTANCGYSKSKIIHSGKKLRQIPGVWGQSPHHDYVRFLIDLCGNRSAGVL